MRDSRNETFVKTIKFSINFIYTDYFDYKPFSELQSNQSSKVGQVLHKSS